MTDTLIITGDARAVLADAPDNSVDAVVTDPPYGLSREPDALEVLRHWLAGDDYEHTGAGFMGKSWDSFVPGPTLWREVLRVLKPGGHACVFAGSRTVDLMGLSLRIAGFEIRDQLQWLYGTGFPKSLDVSKAIDKAAGAERAVIGSKIGLPGYHLSGHTGGEALGHGLGSSTSATRAKSAEITAPATEDAQRWSGWGTALKPAHEPIILARKPLSGTVAANVLAHGTGGLAIDACRIGSESTICAHRAEIGYHGGNLAEQYSTGSESGRWPANVILDPEAGAMLDEQSGIRAAGAFPAVRNRTMGYHGGSGGTQGVRVETAPGGASRFFYCAKASRAEREAGLDAFRKATAGELTGGRAEGSDGLKSPRAGAGRTSSGRANIHPTVKPIDLMRWLVRLVTPPGGLVLDPFAGSGSTGCAAVLEHAEFLGCELSEEYATVARARIAHWSTQR